MYNDRQCFACGKWSWFREISLSRWERVFRILDEAVNSSGSERNDEVLCDLRQGVARRAS